MESIAGAIHSPISSGRQTPLFKGPDQVPLELMAQVVRTAFGQGSTRFENDVTVF